MLKCELTHKKIMLDIFQDPVQNCLIFQHIVTTFPQSNYIDIKQDECSPPRLTLEGNRREWTRKMRARSIVLRRGARPRMPTRLAQLLGTSWTAETKQKKGAPGKRRLAKSKKPGRYKSHCCRLSTSGANNPGHCRYEMSVNHWCWVLASPKAGKTSVRMYLHWLEWSHHFWAIDTSFSKASSADLDVA